MAKEIASIQLIAQCTCDPRSTTCIDAIGCSYIVQDGESSDSRVVVIVGADPDDTVTDLYADALQAAKDEEGIT